MFSTLYEKIVRGEEKLALVGLGYVGMPIAVEFSKHVPVIGFDINSAKIEAYRNGTDPTQEAGNEAIAACTVDWTDKEDKLREAKFIIVAVPTPVKDDTHRIWSRLSLPAGLWAGTLRAAPSWFTSLPCTRA